MSKQRKVTAGGYVYDVTVESEGSGGSCITITTEKHKLVAHNVENYMLKHLAIDIIKNLQQQKKDIETHLQQIKNA